MEREEGRQEVVIRVAPPPLRHLSQGLRQNDPAADIVGERDVIQDGFDVV